MDDDEDNDERQENDQQEGESNSVGSYSKKKYFGKSSREIRLLTSKISYRPKASSLKAWRVTLQNTVNNTAFNNTTHKVKIQHKEQFQSLVSKTNLNATYRNLTQFQFMDLSNTLTKKVDQHTLTFTSKVNHKSEFSLKFGHSIKMFNTWKFKYALDVDRKKQSIFGCSANIQKKWIHQNNSTQFKLFKDWTDTVNFGANLKSSMRKKFEAFYKGKFTTSDDNKLYLQHKFAYDPSNNSPFNNVLTINCQDSLGIGTLNGSLTFENLILKNKQFRFVVQFQKKWVLGVQRRNEIMEFVMQRNKIGYSWMRNFKAAVGNKGFFASIDGKISLPKIKNIDYTFCYKLKQIQNNIYDDSNIGFNFRWNI